ncbi:type II toxin-antitoxin system RelE/ParE family toxin [endosymbiont GvMRE of Glomus versiforme]|uniref:type II toxin-antitoxin system RelE/ParE family toxin n=1 Tax=endosymbiont GvMRE of Glomus versiforme TaxID=2039283 RepID=UPI000EC74F36|nr:type II toxin-antitoxin system RelE/ParE family toxin [endosymbiont GvMRE of Glomus versiforme]RHZ37569.1 Plasmid maintenance system killer protein [endosymbiont GvMRE of Glomus versiforme]
MLKKIATFKDKDTHDFFFGKRIKEWEKFSESARSKLKILNRIGSLQELTNAFDARLHKLHGDRKGQYAIRINSQYRICFYWIKNYAHEVEITDYH